MVYFRLLILDFIVNRYQCIMISKRGIITQNRSVTTIYHLLYSNLPTPLTALCNLLTALTQSKKHFIRNIRGCGSCFVYVAACPHKKTKYVFIKLRNEALVVEQQKNYLSAFLPIFCCHFFIFLFLFTQIPFSSIFCCAPLQSYPAQVKPIFGKPDRQKRHLELWGKRRRTMIHQPW